MKFINLERKGNFKHLVLYENIGQIFPNALQTRCYMCIQWTRVLYSVVIIWQFNPPISQFSSPYNEFMSVWSMFVYNTKTIIVQIYK